MRQSETIDALATALAKAQGTIKSAMKDSVNPHFKSKYADLASVREACAEALSKNEIAVIQAHDMDDAGNFYLATRLVHKTGQWVEARYPIKPVKEDPQGFASATTYARRISLASMVGVVADDDDGNAASEGKPHERHEAPARPQVVHAKPAEKQKTTGSYTDGCLEHLKKIKTSKELNIWLDDQVGAMRKLEELDLRNSERLADAIAMKMDSFNNLKAG